tara:strand:- start:94 stop:570 length:477 start_codon:yes stop_codon:yes gene_type:complete
LKSNLVSKSETAKVLGQINSQWKIKLPKQKNLKFHHINESGIIITGNGITAVKIADDILPFLDNISILEMLPNVMVDTGAIKFVCKGANVMRPGITKFSTFEKGQIVCVVEESQRKFLAVGKAEMSSEEMKETDKGMVVKNMHYISDDYWEANKKLKP